MPEKCPQCGSSVLVRLSSTQEILCGDCKTVSPWKLKENQAPLVTSSRDRRK